MIRRKTEIEFTARVYILNTLFASVCDHSFIKQLFNKNEYMLDILEQIRLLVSGMVGIKGSAFIFLAEHHAVAGHVAPWAIIFIINSSPFCD